MRTRHVTANGYHPIDRRQENDETRSINGVEFQAYEISLAYIANRKLFAVSNLQIYISKIKRSGPGVAQLPLADDCTHVSDLLSPLVTARKNQILQHSPEVRGFMSHIAMGKRQ
jgi:hypothetical protein